MNDVAASIRRRSSISRARASAPAWQLPEGLEGFAASGDELLSMADRVVPAIIEGVAGAQDVLLLAGEEKKALKTWLALELAICRVVGGEWLGRAVQPCVTEHVLIITPETHASVVARRLRALCVGRGLDPRAVLPRIHVAGDRVTAAPYDEIESTWRAAGLKAHVDALRVPDPDRREKLKEGALLAADVAQARLGPGIQRWRALLDSPPGTWGLVIIDTVRTALHGDENSSRDAARYSQACRDLSRRLGCLSVHVHHTSKANQGGARSARGSTELTAGVDGVLSIETNGECPTLTFTLRSFIAPEPIGYELTDTMGGGVRIDTREPSVGAARRKGAVVDEAEVQSGLERLHPVALTVSSLRKTIAAMRGGKPGAKVSHDAVVTALASLEKRGVACRTTISRPRGGGTFEGWQLGATPVPAEAEHVDVDGEDRREA
jgi:AAA domain